MLCTPKYGGLEAGHQQPACLYIPFSCSSVAMHYSGTPFNGHLSMADTCDITDISKINVWTVSPWTSIHVHSKPLNSGHYSV